jgi:hypothetical protein
MSPSMRSTTNTYDGSPRTPLSSFSSPAMSLSYQTTPQMSESVLPMSGSLLNSGDSSDVFVLSQHTPSAVMDVNSFTNYSPDYLTQNLWADSSIGVNGPDFLRQTTGYDVAGAQGGDGMAYDLSFDPVLPLSPPKSSSVFF